MIRFFQCIPHFLLFLIIILSLILPFLEHLTFLPFSKVSLVLSLMVLSPLTLGLYALLGRVEFRDRYEYYEE